MGKFILCCSMGDKEAMAAFERWCKVLTGKDVYSLLGMAAGGLSSTFALSDLEDERKRPTLQAANEPKLIVPGMYVGSVCI